MVAFLPRPVHVRAPATSANLGPGFDSFGLALALHDDVTAAIGREGLSIEVEGHGGALPHDETHLVVRAMRATFERLGGQPPGLVLTARNRIPHGRGLGSSAAAIVSGVVLARGLVDGGSERLPDAEAFELATALEGHPDNVAACLFGGFTIAWTDAGSPRVARVPKPAVRPVVLVPAVEASTEVARALLPPSVPHADAARGAARSALLTALLTGAVKSSPELWLAATDDRLHQPYRAAAMPATAALVGQLRAGGFAAVVSGAGPSVLVLRAPDEAGAELEIERIRGCASPEWTLLAPEVDVGGAALH